MPDLIDEFEKGRLYSMSSFDCENKGKVKNYIGKE